MSNSTLSSWHTLRSSSNLTSYVLSQPAFYHVDGPQIFPSISDASLSLLAPILAYWLYSLFFYFLDTSNFRFLDRYRIHESKEVQSRNAVTVREVIVAVVFQQVIQTVLGVFLLEETARAGTSWFGDVSWVSWLVDSIMMVVFGRRVADQILEANGARMVWWTFWWGIPIAQITFGL
jgi:sphinganine C4-monooxygenase